MYPSPPSATTPIRAPPLPRKPRRSRQPQRPSLATPALSHPALFYTSTASSLRPQSLIDLPTTRSPHPFNHIPHESKTIEPPPPSLPEIFTNLQVSPGSRRPSASSSSQTDSDAADGARHVLGRGLKAASGNLPDAVCRKGFSGTRTHERGRGKEGVRY